MDPQQRGRSPSAGRMHESIRRSHSPSIPTGFNQQANARGLDPILLSQGNYANGLGDSAQSNQQSAFPGSDFLRPDLSQHFAQQPDLSQDNFMQAQDDQGVGDYHNSFNQQHTNFSSGFQNPQFNNDAMNNVDPGFLQAVGFPNDTPYQGFNPSSQPQQFHTPATTTQEFMAPMQPTLPSQNFPDGMSYPAHTNQFSSSLQQNQTSSGRGSRGHSLSPATASNPTGQLGNNEWAGITSSFRGHRRHASDAYSDISSISNLSPFVDAQENFDHINGHSPMMNGQNDPSIVPETLGLSHFNLSDQQLPSHISPGHSAHASPHMAPQHPINTIEGGDQFGLMSAETQFVGADSQMYQHRLSRGVDAFPSITFSNGPEMGDVGNAAQMETPEISIQLAPEGQQNFNEQGRHRSDTDALSPPARSRSRQRNRAISDPYSTASLSRPSTPGRQRSPSAGAGLHPSHSQSGSPSPGPANGVTKSRDRASSTSSIPANRGALLSLVDSNRQQQDLSNASISGSLPSNTGDVLKRTQKHPATFQCSLCPKRFTRAYNLRSHLRTHTDERPFVCTVCGKAFARQHDRKRHEGLHSGEKKFVCKGLLANGPPGANTWGCSRRFARADALGRHFRSEAGRACIKPLLDEEARERRAAMIDQANQDMINNAAQHPHNMASQQQQMNMGPGMGGPNDPFDVSGVTLPAALLAQYPALAGIQWDALPPGQGGMEGDMEGDMDEDYGFDVEGANSGRSSFEASSGGELEFEDDGSGLDPSFGGNAGGMANQNAWMGGDMSMAQQHQQHQQQGIPGGVGGWNGGYTG